ELAAVRPPEPDADAVSAGATLSEQDRVATVKDSTTAGKSTQTTPATPGSSTSTIAALKEPKVWTNERRILVRAIVLLLLALAGFLMWPHHQEAPMQANQPTIENLNRPSKSAEAQLADQGNAAANFNLGLRYENGDGVPKDLGKAAELYQKAADQGYARAQVNLGWLYENGWGVSKALGKAAELYQKAADQGNAAAQNNLGTLYEKGEGVPKDLERARELYQKAADQGNQYAIATRNRLSKPAEPKLTDQENAATQFSLGQQYQFGR